MRRITVLGIVLLLVSLSLAVAGNDNPRMTSVQVTINCGVHKDGKLTDEKTYQLVALANGSDTRLHSGWRVPIATTTFDTNVESNGGLVPVTSYTYQNVGFEARLRAHILDHNQVRLAGSIEDSHEVRIPGRDSPKIRTLSSAFDAIIAEGKPLETLSMAGPDGESLTVEIEVEILN